MHLLSLLFLLQLARSRSWHTSLSSSFFFCFLKRSIDDTKIARKTIQYKAISELTSDWIWERVKAQLWLGRKILDDTRFALTPLLLVCSETKSIGFLSMSCSGNCLWFQFARKNHFVKAIRLMRKEFLDYAFWLEGENCGWWIWELWGGQEEIWGYEPGQSLN